MENLIAKKSLSGKLSVGWVEGEQARKSKSSVALFEELMDVVPRGSLMPRNLEGSLI